jgi:hypothetical protein
MESELLADLDPDERAALLATLERLVAAIT